VPDSRVFLAQKDKKLRDYYNLGVALRRALAQFNGLLTTGSNRKIPITEVALLSGEMFAGLRKIA
jgi:hypothetical protein